ncbi:MULTISPECIES: glycerol-3-phosphate dehydrogenase [Sphingomonas]|uniref:glycerol-3-phosphate dehydrogenase n=2 Tax=Sphingomonadaceae TaxID=41297 RepID=UPI0006FECF3D|nr:MULTISPECIES: glycerol-3-phosphate dehydrogenase [Sphingomonas]KQM92893.1 glycerol-3-phosphate dehydrogenase [Sphingomonas sp. Leaf226]MDY0967419.1 glycerol-3-phosphate dehydrogenase [Sphingomonas sp. CFBP9021]USR01061.1 glycerol-3-phosphate dehydrogenase [Sphingomonas aerolata]
MMKTPAKFDVDLLIVGGGINGTGIARDAAGRGLSVLLVEQDDLASHTSSASTKLIHGGLRYLEYGELRLVREALIERERLLAIAPHIIWPLQFVLPQTHSPRPAWMVRLGLFLYDHLGGRKVLPATRTVHLDRDPLGDGLKPGATRAFVYSDCWVEDSRLVVLNARDAAEHGATILTRTRLVATTRRDGGWSATIADAQGERTVTARVLVNAAGPWVADVLGKVPDSRRDRGVRLIKGSHIVVPRLYAGDHALLLQNPDKRVVFAIPYEGRFTLIGTTDEAWQGAPGPATIDAAETAYLCDTIDRYFQRGITPADIVWSYSGIRPLYDDHAANASAVTRDYVLDLDAAEDRAAMLSIFGGKITTYRKLAEHAMTQLAPFFPDRNTDLTKSWTATVALPGGDLPESNFDRYLEALIRAYPDLPAALLRRLGRAYGTRVDRILGAARTTAELGEDFGAGLHAAEIDYLVDQEWARSAADILYRRSKLGLHVPADAAARIDAYLADRIDGAAGGAPPPAAAPDQIRVSPA